MPYTQTEDLLSIVRLGLQPRAAIPKKIIVIGAGMAGLVAGYELRRAGHDVTILEAQKRVGGRIHTLREPFGDNLYAEAGAMRLPTTHKLTQTYIKKFGLQTREFTKVSTNAFYYLHGRRYLMSDVSRDPACLGLDFAGPNGDQTVFQLWDEMLRPTIRRLEADEGYWDECLSKYGDFSVYDFLRSQGWSTDSISAFAFLEGFDEPIRGISFLEAFIASLAWHADMVQISGGMDNLPRAFIPELKSCIRLGTELVALDYNTDSVIVHTKAQAELEQLTGDFAIVAIPYPALRSVDVLKPFSSGKQMAVRQVPYVNAAKVFLQCRRRFWEEDEGLFGGSTETDLPIRSIYYPDHGRETKRGVLIGCYAYAEDAAHWASLLPEDRIAQTLKYVAMIHPQVTNEFERGFSKVWSEDKFAGGGATLFDSGQPARLYSHMVAPEGPVHFAGEHTSLKHFWVEGAVESGLRAAQEVHERSLMAASS